MKIEVSDTDLINMILGTSPNYHNHTLPKWILDHGKINGSQDKWEWNSRSTFWEMTSEQLYAFYRSLQRYC